MDMFELIKLNQELSAKVDAAMREIDYLIMENKDLKERVALLAQIVHEVKVGMGLVK